MLCAIHEPCIVAYDLFPHVEDAFTGERETLREIDVCTSTENCTCKICMFFCPLAFVSCLSFSIIIEFVLLTENYLEIFPWMSSGNKNS